MYVIILAGGGGTRLWPLSTPARPKPFLPLLNGRSLIRRTFERVVPGLVAAEDVFVVTDRRYIGLVADELPELGPGQVIGEPAGRNTAAAVALGALAVDRPDEDVMVVLPADHEVLDEQGFRDSLVVAAGLAAERGIAVTLGINPTGPETGYGYILARPPAHVVDGRATFPVERFVEKPDPAKARVLLDTGLAAWNAGIFLWRRATIRDLLERHAPDIIGTIASGLGPPVQTGSAAGSRSERGAALSTAAFEVAYDSVRATSIDYAVLEPASLERSVWVVPVAVGWSDLGSWAALRDAAAAEARAAGRPDAAVGSGPYRDLGSSGSLVLAGDRLVVTIGLRDTIVVDTPDALLVCAADHSQLVRQIAEELAAVRTREDGS